MINEELTTDHFKGLPKFGTCKVGMRIECLDAFGDPIKEISGVILELSEDKKEALIQSSYGFGKLRTSKMLYNRIKQINQQEY
ncbi:hypothetical protein MA9V2_263 [Chryseobacterium phage MA9V-2]|nr:hypothetical protein MA9V2_263 [Chryseobacterium phage MA9V-2]